MDFVGKKATGELPTEAAWMRRFVAAHPGHAPESTAVEPAVAAALVRKCADIGDSKCRCAALHGGALHTLGPRERRTMGELSGGGGAGGPKGVRLRGSSFRDEVAASAMRPQCALVRELVAKYAHKAQSPVRRVYERHEVKKGLAQAAGGKGLFASTAPFLSVGKPPTCPPKKPAK